MVPRFQELGKGCFASFWIFLGKFQYSILICSDDDGKCFPNVVSKRGPWKEAPFTFQVAE